MIFEEMPKSSRQIWKLGKLIIVFKHAYTFPFFLDKTLNVIIILIIERLCCSKRLICAMICLRQIHCDLHARQFTIKFAGLTSDIAEKQETWDIMA